MIPDDPRLSFDEASHTYTHSGTGIALPSVTLIMKPMSLMLYEGIPPDVLANAAARGTRAHEQTAQYDRYGFLETDEDTQPYVEAYLRFTSDYKPAWVAVEWRSFHNALMYAGTLDRMGFVTPDDGNGYDLVDLKTTRVFHSVMLSTQLAGYAEIAKSQGHRIRKCYGLQLMNTGDYRFQEVAANLKTFSHCLALHNEMAKEHAA